MTDPDFDQRLNDALKRNNLNVKGDEVVASDDSADALSGASSGLAMGMRLSMEFLVGTLIGLGIGWGLDTFFDTMPWLTLIFTLLGFGAGIMNVYRVINDIDEGIGINRRNVLTKETETPTSKPTD
jgi:F0F1-type ATP synthase assembly protein I